MIWKFQIVAALAIFFTFSFSAKPQPISLAGQWRFALDRKDGGVSDRWFNRDLADKINLPGALQSQGYGDEISTNTPWVLSLYDKNWFLREDYTNYTKAGAVKVPFLCQPPRHYLGAAWYQREIEIPRTGKIDARFCFWNVHIVNRACGWMTRSLARTIRFARRTSTNSVYRWLQENTA